MHSLRICAAKIDQQVRSALLDVDAAKKLVDVAKSNVELATQTVSDETDRVNAGVDDNLPLVTAQSSLASAQTNYVQSLVPVQPVEAGAGAVGGRDRAAVSSVSGKVINGLWLVVSRQSVARTPN